MEKDKLSLSRRDFFTVCGLAGLGVTAACASSQELTPSAPAAVPTTRPTKPSQPVSKVSGETNTLPQSEAQTPTEAAQPDPGADAAYLAVARGADAQAITRAAIAALGGMAQFVKGGSNVIIKPNICTDYYTYEYAATTNPDVVAALVQMCLEAGAKRVRVMDMPFGGSPETAYERSGIKAAVQAAGGQMEIMNRNKYQKADIPQGVDLKECEFYGDILSADLVINVPIAKHHNLARLTLGGKNLLGTIATPSLIHANMGQRVADLISRVRPGLTVIDAVRILMNNGPTGGSLDDVKQTNTVIASADIVTADAYAATLFDLTGADVSYVQAAADRGLGRMDWKSVKLAEVTL